MGKQLDEISDSLTDWITKQHVFFVATSPLSEKGLINCSPKGLDCFRIVGPKEVAYLDLTGSGVETIAHLRENGRIVLMFCAFQGPPKIVRFHGVGEAIFPDSTDWQRLRLQFPNHPGVRSIIRVKVSRIGESCGFSVPLMEYVSDRDKLNKVAESKGEEGIREYQKLKNTRSLDGLPGIPS